MRFPIPAISRLWHRIPTVVRAIVVGFVVFEVGVAVWVLVVAPLIPAPLSLAVMCAVLWAYCKYFSGSWWSGANAASRRNSFREIKLSPDGWRWGLLGALAFVILIQAGFVVTFRIMEFPAEAFIAEYDVDAMPGWLAWLFIIMSSLVAGICEETGFRGYMQVPLEERYGPAVAVTIVSGVFLGTHLHQAWAYPILIHVFTISMLLGMLAYSSGSLIPGMIAHAAMDIINFSYWWSDIAGSFRRQPVGKTGIDPHFLVWLLVLLASSALFTLVICRMLKLRRRTGSRNDAIDQCTH